MLFKEKRHKQLQHESEEINDNNDRLKLQEPKSKHRQIYKSFNCPNKYENPEIINGHIRRCFIRQKSFRGRCGNG